MVTQTMSLVDPAVREAIHAPNKVWNQSVYYLFGGGPDDDPSECFTVCINYEGVTLTFDLGPEYVQRQIEHIQSCY